MGKAGRYVKCPCGHSDGGDDVIDSYSVLDRSYNGSELVIRESRKCDICHKYYTVIMHYKLQYEEAEKENNYGIILQKLRLSYQS